MARKVKTRLAKGSNHRFAANAYLALLSHSIRELSTLNNVVLASSPTTKHGSIRRLCRQHEIQLQRQPNGRLGQRMAKTIRQGLQQHQAVAIVGTDCPEISSDTLVWVRDQLQSSAPCCVVPAKDGGYVLVASSQYQPALFQSIHWSSPSVLRQTRRQARRLGIRLPATTAMTDIDQIQEWRAARRQGLVGPLWKKAPYRP